MGTAIDCSLTMFSGTDIRLWTVLNAAMHCHFAAVNRLPIAIN
jgi:hypothetical protein